MSTKQTLIIIIVMSLTTFLTRVIPFILFPGNKETPKIIQYLGNVLPYAIIGMLVIFCYKSVAVTVFPYGIPELIATVFVIIVHKWKHNLLLSIAGGTILYMILVQMVFI